MSGYIYVVYLREFLRSGEPVLKVGYTLRDMRCRMKEYSKGSLCLAHEVCTQHFDDVKV